jgi:hypothetical protein
MSLESINAVSGRLSDSKDVLGELVEKLKPYIPRKSRKLDAGLQAVKWSLKDRSRTSILNRLSRCTEALQLSLLTLSLYVLH